MDAKYQLGIAELDAQHDEIEKTILSLKSAIANKDRWHVIHYLLETLYDQLRFHFAVEESVMQIFAYPETDEHKNSHQLALKTVLEFKNHNLTGTAIEQLTMPPAIQFYEQILTHDTKLAEFLRSLLTPVPG